MYSYYVVTKDINGVSNVVDEYGTGLGGRGILIQTDEINNLRHNYKLVDGKIIPLSEKENHKVQQIDICPAKTVEEQVTEIQQQIALLQSQVSDLVLSDLMKDEEE